MTTTRPRGHPPRRRTRTTPPATLPTTPSPAALSECVALLAARTQGLVLDPSGDIPPGDLLRAMVGITLALLDDAFPDDRGAALLRLLGATVAGHTGT